METLYNILHLSGAFCLILYSVIGLVFIYRWWDHIKTMEAQIKFIFEIQNELLLKSMGQVPKRSHFDKEFFKKGEDVVVHGAPPGFVEMLRGKDGRIYRTVLEAPTPESENVGEGINLNV